MNRREKDALLEAQLEKSFSILEKTKAVLDVSFDRCKGIALVRELSEENLESFEALTARYARFLDIAFQKVLKTLFLLLRETPGAVIDQASLAEKLRIIPDSEVFLELRELRNMIAHEYAEEDLRKLFKNILQTRKKIDLLFNSLTASCRKHVRTAGVAESSGVRKKKA